MTAKTDSPLPDNSNAGIVVSDACSASSDEDVVLNAGMEIESGLAWLQAGNVLIDGTDAPEWMWKINGFDVDAAAEIIRQNA